MCVVVRTSSKCNASSSCPPLSRACVCECVNVVLLSTTNGGVPCVWVWVCVCVGVCVCVCPCVVRRKRREKTNFLFSV